MVVKYINSQNKEFDFKNSYIKLRDGNFHNVSWKYKGVARQYGVEIQQFEKDPIMMELVFVASGPISERKILLNDIHAAMEVDKLNKKQGKLFWNDAYIEGYFMKTKTNPGDNGNKTINETEFLAPYPFWITEQSVQIKPISNADTSEKGIKKYPYTYPYKYPLLRTETKEYVDHYTDSDFKLTVHGPTPSVLINIAGHPYEVNYPLEAGERMIIDSRPQTPKEEKLYVVHNNGEKENIFNYRSVENSVFKKIPSGMVEIDYPRTYGVDLVIFKERSEPPWKS